MSLLENTLSGATGFAGFNTVEANGLANYGTLVAPPNGIPGRLWFDNAPDGSPALYSRCVQGDALNVGGTRAEITLADTELLGAGLFDTAFLYSWEIYVPSSWPQTGTPYTIMQMHDWPDDGESPSWPNFELMIQNKRVIPKISADYYNIGPNSIDMLSVPAVFDRWVRCCLFARWDKAGTNGFMEFIYDGKIVDRRANIRSNRPDAKGPYFRLGVYDCLHGLDFGMLEAWYRNAKWSYGTDGYVSALGKAPEQINCAALTDNF